MLTVRDLTTGYGDEPVVKDIRFEVQNGEALAITGPPEAGKSTLLRAIAGDLEHTGTVDASEVGWLVPAAAITVDQLLDLGGGDHRGFA